jgi:hypothetical protein
MVSPFFSRGQEPNPIFILASSEDLNRMQYLSKRESAFTQSQTSSRLFWLTAFAFLE